MRLKGWKELGMEVSKIYEEMPDTSPIFLFSDRYQVSSELAFYVNGQPRTYCINNGRRMNQYDLWPDINSEAEKIKSLNKNIQINGIYVRTGNGTIPSNVEDAFDSCEKRAFSAFDRGKRLIREYSIFICYNFKGLKNPKPDRF
jgi:undecaprenyl-diphosphatase